MRKPIIFYMNSMDADRTVVCGLEKNLEDRFSHAKAYLTMS